MMLRGGGKGREENIARGPGAHEDPQYCLQNLWSVVDYEESEDYPESQQPVSALLLGIKSFLRLFDVASPSS